MYRYTDASREEYLADGCTVLRGLIPSSLLADLRRETDIARDIARRQGGPQCQRLQPVYRYEELDQRPFRDFLALPELRRAVAGILGPEHRESDIMGVLLEPAERPWCTSWHRDWRDHGPLPPGAWDRAARDYGMFNQLNGALYPDSSLWFVPGSHGRDDTDAERAAFGGVPAPGPALTDAMSNGEREAACLAYARRMPGAVQLHLEPGDVAFYRACAWHLGSYTPHAKRATLHDGFYGPADRQWQADVPAYRESFRQE